MKPNLVTQIRSSSALMAILAIATACSARPMASTATPPVGATAEQSATPVDRSLAHPHHGHSMNMDLGPADANYELRFVDAMIPHHQGAIVMAKEVLQKSQRPEMRKLAQAMIQAQTQEIAEMTQWRSAWYPSASTTRMAWHAPMGHMMAMSSEQMQGMMMSMDLGTADQKFDLRFLNAMIPHHEGALVMAKDALQKATRPELKQLAQSILKSQQAEIDQMKQWQRKWYQQ